MATNHSGAYRRGLLGRSWWQPILLGIVLILVGLFVLRNAVAATVATAIVFGISLLAAGLFEIIHSFWVPHWGGFLWKLLVGAAYAIAGGVLVADPLAASVPLTLAFAAAMFASGGVRMYLATRDWHPLNALLFTSGIVGILASFVIVAKWPLDSLWVFGLMAGLDLLLHGIWWVAHGWSARHEPRPA